mgnify:CR=1 FL=1
MKRRRLSLAVCIALSFAALSPAQALERKDVPEKYKWNTADLFTSEAEWAKLRADINARLGSIASFQGTLGQSPARFHEALAAIMKIDQDLSKLKMYATMRSDEDARVSATREMKQAAEDLGVKFTSAHSYLKPEILALGADQVRAFLSSEKRLQPYAPWLEDILRYAPHTLSAAEEKVAAQAGTMAEGAGNAYNILKDADLPFPQIELGKEQVRLDTQAYTKYRASPDRAVRDKVFRSFFTTLAGFEGTFGSMLDSQVKAHIFNKDVHKYGSTLEAALFPSAVPTAVYERLIADVHRNLPTLHRYLKLRQRMLGLDQVRYEDLYAPIVKNIELHYTPEQARDLVIKAVAPLGEQYVADLKTAFTQRWMDILPTTGKRAGAYSTGVYGVHPFQLENFDGLYNGVSTSAHELGHSMHTLLSHRHQPYPTADYKIFVAEVASTLNENLLLEYMLSQTKDKQTRLFLLGSYLDGLRTTLFRQTLFAEFEWRIHELGEKGEPLTGEKLTLLYRKLLKEYYGDAAGICKIDDLYGIEWAYIPHFYYNFYVYQYATSITASAQIASRIRADPTGESRDAYLQMLSAGSSKPPLELLKDAGVDLTTPEPFDAAIKQMNRVMDEMEKLL